jgi:general secretion pathway protein F
MPTFFVKAVGRDGEIVETLRDAPNEAELIHRLQEEGLLPIRVARAEGAFAWLKAGLNRSKLRSKDITLFTRELATLLSAGLPLDRSLKVLLAIFPEGTALNALVERILEQVKGGSQLSAALEAEGGLFPKLYVSMVRAGEAGGALESVLERLADYLERSQALRASVLTALIYPAILLGVAVLSLLVLLTFVVPQFEEMFQSAGKELPLPTQIVMALASGIKHYGLGVLLGTLVLLRLGQKRLKDDPKSRYLFHRLRLRLPLFGELEVKLETARLAQTPGDFARGGGAFAFRAGDRQGDFEQLGARRSHGAGGRAHQGRWGDVCGPRRGGVFPYPGIADDQAGGGERKACPDAGKTGGNL